MTLTLWKHCFPESESQNIFQALYSSTPWRQDSIRIFGKITPIPRLQAWYADDGLTYRYSGIELQPLPWTPVLTTLKKYTEEKTGHHFNSVLLNLYRDGQDSNGWHSDDEPELGMNPVIASLSFGEARQFRLRHKQARQNHIKPVSLDLTAGSLLLMTGQTQSHWQHCLPKTARKAGPRINLTFRKIVN